MSRVSDEVLFLLLRFAEIVSVRLFDFAVKHHRAHADLVSPSLRRHTLRTVVSTLHLLTLYRGNTVRSLDGTFATTSIPRQGVTRLMLFRRSVGWLNLMGQVAGVASTAFGLAQMILAAVSLPLPFRVTKTEF